MTQEFFPGVPDRIPFGGLHAADPFAFRRHQLEEVAPRPQRILCTLSGARSVILHSLARLIRQHR